MKTELLVIGNKSYNLANSKIPQEVVEYLKAKIDSSNNPTTLPPLSSIYNVLDFEPIAEKYIEDRCWNYFRTGAADELTLRENMAAFRRIYFKPRILRDVTQVDTSTGFFGTKVKSPFYISAFYGSHFPSSNAQMGEKPLVTAAGKRGLMQMLPQLSQFSLEEILLESSPGQKHWLQIYVSVDIDETIDLIKRAEKSGKVEALFFTVDAAQLGRRETDLKLQGESGFVKSNTAGVGHAASLNWDTLKALRQVTKLKLVLKGVQCVEDALKAAEYGFEGILISNHGGRQLDTTRSSVEILGEVVPILKTRNLFDKVEIYIDGGIRRGSDIAKLLCLGAKGVGLGRPVLYPLVTYGEAGVLKALDILQQDLELNMRLLGCASIDDLHAGLLDTNDLFRNRVWKL